MIRSATVALLACASLGLQLRAAPQDQPTRRAADEPDRGTLAVLRRDGLLVPFASLSGTTWTMYWPMYLGAGELPITMSAIPRAWWGGAGRQPQTWRLWKPSGESQAIGVSSLTTVRMHCAGRLAFNTNYKSTEPLPPGPVEPFPKEGLVVGGNLEFLPIEHVPPESPERAALAVAMLAEFDNAEDATVRAVRRASSWAHPIEPTLRRKTPVRIESWYRAPIDDEGGRLSFVEAVRAYPPGPEDEGCGLETLFSGWVHSRGEKLVERADLLARVTYCDRVGALYMLPFGRIRARNRTYWVFQMSGWEQEWYTVALPGRRDVRYMAEFLAGTQTSCRLPRR